MYDNDDNYGAMKPLATRAGVAQECQLQLTWPSHVRSSARCLRGVRGDNLRKLGPYADMAGGGGSSVRPTALNTVISLVYMSVRLYYPVGGR